MDFNFDNYPHVPAFFAVVAVRGFGAWGLRVPRDSKTL